MSKIPRESTILNDLMNVAIPEEVKIVANRIFQNLQTGTKRKNNRRRTVFVCVYRAFLELGLTEEPRVVANLVSLGHNEIHKAFSLCSELQTGYCTLIQEKEATHFLPVILRDLGIDIDMEEIEDLLNYVLERDPSLKDDFPQTVAAACICYFLEINGLKVPRVEVAKIIKRSDMTIQKIYKKIARAHNS